MSEHSDLDFFTFARLLHKLYFLAFEMDSWVETTCKKHFIYSWTFFSRDGNKIKLIEHFYDQLSFMIPLENFR